MSAVMLHNPTHHQSTQGGHLANRLADEKCFREMNWGNATAGKALGTSTGTLGQITYFYIKII